MFADVQMEESVHCVSDHKDRQRQEFTLMANKPLEDTNKIKKLKMVTDVEQIIHFTPFQTSKWRELFSSDLQKLKTPELKVSVDKGFNFSSVDSVFVVQKKNHFQLSCQVAGEGEHALVDTDFGCQKIEHFQLNFYGVKKEAPEHRIQVFNIRIRNHSIFGQMRTRMPD